MRDPADATNILLGSVEQAVESIRPIFLNRFGLLTAKMRATTRAIEILSTLRQESVGLSPASRAYYPKASNLPRGC